MNVDSGMKLFEITIQAIFQSPRAVVHVELCALSGTTKFIILAVSLL